MSGYPTFLIIFYYDKQMHVRYTLKISQRNQA